MISFLYFLFKRTYIEHTSFCYTLKFYPIKNFPTQTHKKCWKEKKFPLAFDPFMMNIIFITEINSYQQSLTLVIIN